MIGGTDIIIPTRLSTAAAMSNAARVVLNHWRAGIAQSGTTGAVLGRYADISFASVNELLIYRDADALRRWDEVGADPSTDDTLIHLLAYNRGQLTVVVDDRPSPEVTGLVQGIAELLADRSRPRPRFTPYLLEVA